NTSSGKLVTASPPRKIVASSGIKAPASSAVMTFMDVSKNARSRKTNQKQCRSAMSHQGLTRIRLRRSKAAPPFSRGDARSAAGGWPILGLDLHQQSHPLPTTHTGRRNAIPQAPAFQLARQCHRQAHTSGRQRMTQRNRAAVQVELVA